MTKRGNVQPPAATPQDDGIRGAILAAAKGLIQRYGIRKTTLDDIARAMGKHRSSLYYYFPGKDAVVNALIESEIDEMSRVVREQVEKEDDAPSRLRVFMITRIEQIASRVAVFGEALPEMRSGVDGVPNLMQLAERRRASQEVDQRFMTGILLRGIKEGQFKTLTKEEVDLFTKLIFAAMRGIELELVFNPEPIEKLLPRLEVALNVLFKGLLR
jgi:AcrR family transcriptional regulator